MLYTVSIAIRKERKKMVTLIVCLVVFLIILGGAIGAEGILVVCGIVLVLIAFLGIKWRIEGKQEEKERNARLAAERDNQNLRNFYQMCQKAGITAIQTEADMQKATQIAGTMRLGDVDVKALYLKAASLNWQENRETERKKKQERELALNKVRAEERTKCEEIEKYAGYSGREKRLAILRDQYKKASNSAYQMSKASSVLTTPLVSTRDTDWAIHGGIANGLAGPGVGAATAMNIQRQNAENRARADAINSAYVSSLVRSGTLEKAARAEKEYKDEAEKLQAQIQEAETALVAEDSPQKCFERLRFDGVRVIVSETGTCSVMASAYLKDNFTIFNNVNATVDGTILAEICDGSHVIGCAKLVLPVWGTSKITAEKLEGMALFCGHSGKDYTVCFKAGNLWAMEAMP